MSSVAPSTDTLMPQLSVSQLEQGFGVLSLAQLLATSELSPGRACW